MRIKELVSAIEQKHKKTGIIINQPATHSDIQKFEQRVGFNLPPDFKEFYLICNGFECSEDIFKMISLEDIIKNDDDFGENWFHFSEYMIYSDIWSLRKRGDRKYEIFNTGDVEIILTSSLQEFLEKFLRGNVFDDGGLYEWHEQLKLTL